MQAAELQTEPIHGCREKAAGSHWIHPFQDCDSCGKSHPVELHHSS